jgi:hypothetical protein
MELACYNSKFFFNGPWFNPENKIGKKYDGNILS